MTSRHERFPADSCGIDELAMRKVQFRGDHAAFAELVDRWEAPIRRLCTRMTCDAHRGEDLTQEVFARVFTKRDQFDSLRKFSTWLWRIALNKSCHQSHFWTLW
jgi:DNA-directed RNA polymerase specialized sigma24 family protein